MRVDLLQSSPWQPLKSLGGRLLIGLSCLMTFGLIIPLVPLFMYATCNQFPKELWMDNGRLYSNKKELHHGPLVQHCEVEKVTLRRKYGRLWIWFVQIRYPKLGFEAIDNSGRRARRRSSDLFAVNYIWAVGGSPAIFAMLEKLVQAGIQDKGAYELLLNQQMHQRDIHGIVRTS